MPISILPLLLLLLTSFTTATHSRRALHEPFFPLSSPPPPSPPPPSPPIPKYPSSSTPTDPSPPFFPFDPAPPPPPTLISIPTFPANLSFPNSSPSPHPHPVSKLIPTVLLPLLALSLLSFALTFFLLYRRRNRSATDNARKRSSPSEFLYLGTLVSSCRRTDDDPLATAAAAASPYYKLSSPELRPLPPLSGQNYANADSSEEEFYSPRASSADKGTRTSPDVVIDNGGSPSSTLSTPSYPSSNSASSPPIGSSPARSAVKSPPSTRSSSATPPLPPPPPPVLRPSPMRNSPSPPPPASSPEKESRMSQPSSRSVRIQNGNPFADDWQPVPPPPPPPPPAGYWESRVRRPRATAPISIEMKSSTLVEVAENREEAGDKREETSRPKLKPLHWDKVRASSDRATVWDQLKSSSFQVNEEMIESLFVCNPPPPNTMPKETEKRQVLAPAKQENRVLDPKKSQNIAILLRALNVTKEEVCEALLEGNTDNMGAELLETLLKMAPTKEEELKLKAHKDDSPLKLGPAEKFLKAVLDIPFAFKRVDAMLYIANFDSEVKYLKNSFETLELQMIRTEGSRLSAANPSASKTEPSTLQDDLKYKKLGLQAVAGLKDELGNVKKAAAMDSDVLSGYVSKLAGGIGKVSEVMRLDERQGSEGGRQFHEAMSGFLKKVEDGIIKVQAQESVALSLV